MPLTYYPGCKGIYNKKGTAPAIYAIPKVGNIIVINERHVCRKRPYLDNVQKHGYRGCVYVASESPNIITCKEYYNEDVSHTISFQKKDFQCGLLRYIVVEQPIYKKDHNWHDYAIDKIMHRTV